MSNLAALKSQVARAETNIVEGEMRITRQTLHIEEMRERGHDIGRPQALLEAMTKDLEAWRDHRVELLARIAQIEAANVNGAS